MKTNINNIYYVATGEAEPALVIETENGYQYRMNSAYSPVNEVQTWGKQFKKDGIKRVVCLFGLGTGLFAKEILSGLSKDSRMIIFEPEKDILEYCLEAGKDGEPEEKIIAERLEEIRNDSRVILCVNETDSLKFREELMRNLDYYLLENLTVTKHTMYDRLYGEAFRLYLHTVNEVRERILVNKNTLARFRDNASKNVIDNLWIIEKMNTVNCLAKILPREIPVIIVSAGPSLDKNIELLRKAKGHALIFAVDTAIPYLLKRDIIPDLTVTVEPIKPVKHYLDPRSEEIPAVFDCESNSEIVGKHRSRIFVYNIRDYVRRLLEAAGRTPCEDIVSGGSVATAAFAIMYELNMRNIILIGQDLAYSGEATHAGGVESKGINNDIGYEMIEDINGGTVRTRSDWLGYLKWFESVITMIGDMKKDITVTDATEGGARIHGTEVMTLADAIEKYCNIDYDFAEQLKKLPLYLEKQEYEKFLLKKEESFGEPELMRQKAAEALEICDGFLKGRTTDEKETVVLQTKLTQLRRYCEGCMIYPLINNYAVSDIVEEISRLRLAGGTASERRINEIMQQRLAFDAIIKACDAIKEQL